jgi:hypothetical protein
MSHIFTQSQPQGRQEAEALSLTHRHRRSVGNGDGRLCHSLTHSPSAMPAVLVPWGGPAAQVASRPRRLRLRPGTGTSWRAVLGTARSLRHSRLRHSAGALTAQRSRGVSRRDAVTHSLCHSLSLSAGALGPLGLARPRSHQRTTRSHPGGRQGTIPIFKVTYHSRRMKALVAVPWAGLAAPGALDGYRLPGSDLVLLHGNPVPMDQHLGLGKRMVKA